MRPWTSNRLAKEERARCTWPETNNIRRMKLDKEGLKQRVERTPELSCITLCLLV